MQFLASPFSPTVKKLVLPFYALLNFWHFCSRLFTIPLLVHWNLRIIYDKTYLKKSRKNKIWHTFCYFFISYRKLRVDLKKKTASVCSSTKLFVKSWALCFLKAYFVHFSRVAAYAYSKIIILWSVENYNKLMKYN